MRAWTIQDSRRKTILGEAKCPWSVGWYDPEGKKRSKRIGSRSMAVKFQRKVEGQLAAGTYQSDDRKTWKDFCEEYDSKIVSGMDPETKRITAKALDHFNRIVKPKLVNRLKAQDIDGYVAKRRLERGQKRDSKVSPATVNKELRYIKAVLNIACDWGYLPKAPKVRMLKEPKKLPTYVKPDHFAVIYRACDVAQKPDDQPYPAADW